jgi:uncharacterized phage-associated protein
MPYPAAAVANEFLKLARESNTPLTPMKLQKLVYFAHGWYLALTGDPLINEPVEAWKFGPVIPSLYHAYKRYGDSTIFPAVNDEDCWPFSRRDMPRIDDGPSPAENYRAKQVIKRVWDEYGHFSAVQLSNLTHAPDSPWSETPEKDDKKHVPIDQERIRRYFLSQVRQRA